MASHKDSITTAFYYCFSYLKYLDCCKYCKIWLAENSTTPEILVLNKVEVVRGTTTWQDSNKQTIVFINNPMCRIMLWQLPYFAIIW